MPVSAPPLVTFTTDFGTSDFYVAAMKGAVLRQCPQAALVDVEPRRRPNVTPRPNVAPQRRPNQEFPRPAHLAELAAASWA